MDYGRSKRILGLTENLGKADYAASHDKQRDDLQQLLVATNTPGQVTEKPKTLGTRPIMTNKAVGPHPGEEVRIQKAIDTCL